MSTQSGWNLGRTDAQTGKGPANQQNKPYQQRESYNAAYSRQKQQNQGGKK